VGGLFLCLHRCSDYGGNSNGTSNSHWASFYRIAECALIGCCRTVDIRDQRGSPFLDPQCFPIELCENLSTTGFPLADDSSNPTSLRSLPRLHLSRGLGFFGKCLLHFDLYHWAGNGGRGATPALLAGSLFPLLAVGYGFLHGLSADSGYASI